MSMAAPLLVKSGSSDTGNGDSAGVSVQASTKLSDGPSRELTGVSLFSFYVQSFFRIPRDLKNDIIYCQRAIKTHIKIHQIVLDVFDQQPDADPQQKKRILDELESEIYEINAEQNFLFIRLRRVIDEFYKMLLKNRIPTDANATNVTNAIVAQEIVPFVTDTSIDIFPAGVVERNSEEKLIEKYFEVQKDPQPKEDPDVQVIELDDEDNVEPSPPSIRRVVQKRESPKSSTITHNAPTNGDSLLKNRNAGLPQTSLLKPLSQRGVNMGITQPVDFKPKIERGTTLAEMYNQQTSKDTEKEIELPVSTNVRMSRMNLRQALKRAQAAVRGPAMAPPPPPPPPPQPVVTAVQQMPKAAAVKSRATRAAATAAASLPTKSPETTSSSGEGTPERVATPPHTQWPDELEETRTQADEYGQEMFLRMFDLYTPEFYSQMQQRRSKRRRRCVQNINYHYGASATSSNEPEAKKKRKAFLLSPQVKKALPNKRNKRRSADNAMEGNSAPPSRSTSSSPDDKQRACNECFKGGHSLEVCETCKHPYHPHCHREGNEDLQDAYRREPKPILSEPKICPTCKRNNDKLIKKEIMINKSLHATEKGLQLQISKEKERRETLHKTGKSYKLQMSTLFKIVNTLKSEEVTASTSASSTSTKSTATNVFRQTTTNTATNNYVIHVD